MSTISRAVSILCDGGVVAIPTETVYGLAADARNAAAIRKIFAIKGRPSTNPLIVHVAHANVARRFAKHWPDTAERLAESFWPGPLTVVLPKNPVIVDEATAGLGSVGLRVPKHPLTLELLREFDGPLAAPSANRSTRVSPTTAQHVEDEFDGAIDLILDGGPCEVGIESTVIDLTSDVPQILRPGGVTREQIEEIIGPVEVKSVSIGPATVTSPMKSPGQMGVHYAPRTPAFRIEPSQRSAIDLTDAALIELMLDAETYARNFYARLRMLDEQQLKAIYIELPPDDPAWHAVRDRVMRATKPWNG